MKYLAIVALVVSAFVVPNSSFINQSHAGQWNWVPFLNLQAADEGGPAVTDSVLFDPCPECEVIDLGWDPHEPDGVNSLHEEIVGVQPRTKCKNEGAPCGFGGVGTCVQVGGPGVNRHQYCECQMPE